MKGVWIGTEASAFALRSIRVQKRIVLISWIGMPTERNRHTPDAPTLSPVIDVSRSVSWLYTIRGGPPSSSNVRSTVNAVSNPRYAVSELWHGVVTCTPTGCSQLSGHQSWMRSQNLVAPPAPAKPSAENHGVDVSVFPKWLP